MDEIGIASVTGATLVGKSLESEMVDSMKPMNAYPDGTPSAMPEP